MAQVNQGRENIGRWLTGLQSWRERCLSIANRAHRPAKQWSCCCFINLTADQQPANLESMIPREFPEWISHC